MAQILEGQKVSQDTGNPFLGLGVALGVHPIAAVEHQQNIFAVSTGVQVQDVRQQLIARYAGQVESVLSEAPSASRIAINPQTHSVMTVDNRPGIYSTTTFVIDVRPLNPKPGS